jgi:glutamate/tyrosine decarboxylase-like PLP-dependent enzyme
MPTGLSLSATAKSLPTKPSSRSSRPQELEDNSALSFPFPSFILNCVLTIPALFAPYWPLCCFSKIRPMERFRMAIQTVLEELSKRDELLRRAAETARKYVQGIGERRASPTERDLDNLAKFHEPFPNAPGDPMQILEKLNEIGSPATTATTGGRYFGFVNGGTLPASLAANWLAGAWDQNGALRAMSPVAAELEEVVLRWVCEALGLPEKCEGGLVTCATTASFTALAAARHALLARAGWNFSDDGMFGAPPIDVVVGDEVHASLLKALSLAGFGKKRLTRVEADDQGRMRADKLPPLSERTILCIQAGNVNTGAFDPAAEICARAHEKGAWVHVDGAFGLWASVSPKYSHLTKGLEQADSWATDAHKWPNVNYDSGIVLVKDGAALRAAMAISAAYLEGSGRREPMHHTPDSSRRARGVEVWAGLKSLGREGLRSLIERTCEHAKAFAHGFRRAGFQVLNDVVINQVLVSFGSAEITEKVIRAVQEDGTCWCGGTVWQGKSAMRVSVSSWATTDADVQVSLETIVRLAREVRA